MTMRTGEQRATLVVVGVLVGLAGMAWALTVKQAVDMSGMVTGLGQVGSRMPNDMAAPLFMVMWLTMMVAMMLPTIAPMVLAHRMVVIQLGEGRLPTAAFVVGYLAVWTVIGLVPLAAFLAFRNLPMEMAGSSWLPLAGGGVLVAAGVYQFTPLKGICLKACRTPLGFILTHDFRSGAPGAFRAGVHHGAYCLGCCCRAHEPGLDGSARALVSRGEELASWSGLEPGVREPGRAAWSCHRRAARTPGDCVRWLPGALTTHQWRT